MNTIRALPSFLAIMTSSQLCERLLLASVELAVLILFFWITIKIFRVRTTRVCALLWLIVLAKAALSSVLEGPVRFWTIPAVPAVSVVESEPDVKLDPIILPEIEQPLVEVACAFLPFEDVPQDFTLCEIVPFEVEEVESPSSEVAAVTLLLPIPVTYWDEMPEMDNPVPAVSGTVSTELVSPVSTKPTSVALGMPRFSITDWVVMVWLGGVAFMAALTIVDIIRIQYWHRKTPEAAADILALFQDEAQRLGVAKCLRLRVSDQIDSPV